MNRYFATHTPEDADCLEAWRWLIGPAATLWRVTLFGDVLLKDPATGAIDFLDTLEGEVERLAASEEELETVLRDPDVQEEVLMTSLVERELALGKRPGQGECLMFTVDPILGGSFDSSNIQVGLITVHLHILGQIHRQTVNAPPGTRFDGIRIVDPPMAPPQRGGFLGGLKRLIGW